MKAFRFFALSATPILLAAWLVASCGRESETSATVQSVEKSLVVAVAWPELIDFSRIVDQAGVLAGKQDREGIMRMRNSILEGGWAVSPASIPENVRNPNQVHDLLGRLSSLVNGYARSEMPDERLFGLTEALGPVVDALIVASGASRASSITGT